MTKLLSILSLTLALCFLSTSHTHAASILIDFGGATTTLNPGPNNDPIRYWNNVTTGIGTSNTGTLNNLVTTTNTSTGIDLRMSTRFTGTNSVGSTAFTDMPTNATNDSLFGNGGTHESHTNILPEFYFANLDITKTYHLTFFASRTSASDNRETLYTVTGDPDFIFTTSLDAANNLNTTVTVWNITPNPDGEIWIKLTPGPNNNNSAKYIYLNTLELTAVPEPSLASLSLLSLIGLSLRRRR